jgi:hypothetical protein
LRVRLYTPPGKVAILVISPTRELAMQTMKEAQMLLKQHRFQAQCVIGGTNIKSEQRRLSQGGVDILVATPGRLLDHIENSRGVRELLNSVSVLVLDEADKLLEMGFKKDIDRIVSYLPTTGNGRQTLLFSATMPDQLAQLVKNIIAPSHQTIDTVGEDQTNVQVKQEYVVAPFKYVDSLLSSACCHARARVCDPGANACASRCTHDVQGSDPHLLPDGEGAHGGRARLQDHRVLCYGAHDPVHGQRLQRLPGHPHARDPFAQVPEPANEHLGQVQEGQERHHVLLRRVCSRRRLPRRHPRPSGSGPSLACCLSSCRLCV